MNKTNNVVKEPQRSLRTLVDRLPISLPNGDVIYAVIHLHQQESRKGVFFYEAKNLSVCYGPDINLHVKNEGSQIP